MPPGIPVMNPWGIKLISLSAIVLTKSSSAAQYALSSCSVLATPSKITISFEPLFSAQSKIDDTSEYNPSILNVISQIIAQMVPFLFA